MKKLMHVLFGIYILFAFSQNLFAQDNKVKMVSLDWPPYTGEELPQKGASIAVAKAAFAAMGYDLEVKFFPWARALVEAKKPDYLGYFPEYYAKQIEEEYIFSDAMGNGPLGFAERVGNSISWKSLNDLSRSSGVNVGKAGVISIGTVRGYVNEETFDTLAWDETVEKSKTPEGRIKIEPVVDDVTNLKKLAAGRITLAIIDKNVMEYLIQTDPELKSVLKQSNQKLQFNTKVLEDKMLYLCFQRNARGEKYAKIFNQGLKKINVAEIMANYLNSI